MQRQGVISDFDIRTASRLTVDAMVAKLGDISGKRVIDLGAGYGGAARVLAKKHGAHVTCLNLSLKENARNRELTQAAGLSDKISVVDGSFDDIPFADAEFDVAWSQDAILHAPDRLAVLREVERVLKPGGQFVFTDPMQADGLVDTHALQPIYDRIHLADLTSIGFYRKALTDLGFAEWKRTSSCGNWATTMPACVKSCWKSRKSSACPMPLLNAWAMGWSYGSKAQPHVS